MSSNEVQVARISKSGAEVARRNGMLSKILTNNTVVEVDQDDMEEYVFGSISPRGGGIGCSTPLYQHHHQHHKQSIDSPDHTQRDTTESDNNISSCSTLDIINKVEHLTAQQQLELQVRELTQQLKQREEQSFMLQRQLKESNEEKEMCHRRLEMVSAAHECRLTEMHCVIAELSNKLRTKQQHIILEEQEPEGSDISYQEGSIFNSEMNLTNPDAECQTEPIDDVADGVAYSACDDDGCRRSIENVEVPLKLEGAKHIEDCTKKAQVEALKEEVLHLKAKIALLQSELNNSVYQQQTETNKEITMVEKEQAEEEEDYDYNQDPNESIYSLEQQLCMAHTEVYSLNDLNISSVQNDYIKPATETVTSPQKRVPAIAKMAERVKLRCASKADVNNVHAMDILNSQLKNVNLDDSLMCESKDKKDLILQSFVSEPCNNDKDNELQRLQRKVEHLKVRNALLSLSLDECKEHTEQLYLLCGKYESNAVALQIALNCSDRAIEAYDVMLALLESKLALINDKSAAAEDSRKAVESVAQHLLDRLEGEKNICENSLGPWQNTFNIPDSSKSEFKPWSIDDDNRIRYHVSKLKGRRSAVQNTIVKLESPFSDLYEKKRLALEEEKYHGQEKKNAQYDLEMTILMQELLNLRDENMQLKTKVDEAEQDRHHANERINILQLQMQLTAESNALFHQHQQTQENRISYSEAEHVALTEQQLVEALTRENELKGRIQSLIASVSATQKMSDEKYGQLHQNVRELQKSNHNLGQMLEQNKRKYQQRIRKMEQKIADLKLDYERYSVGGKIENVMLNSRAKSPITNHQRHHHNHNHHHQQEHVPETTL